MYDKISKYGNHIISDDENGYMYSFNMSESYDFNSHLHKCHELVHVMEGRMIYTIEGHDYSVSAGDLVVTRPEELHSFSFPEKCKYKREFLHMYPKFLERFPEAHDILYSREAGAMNVIPAETVKKYDIDKVFNEINQYCASPVPETDLMVLTCAVQLVLKLNRVWADDKPSYESVISDKKTNSIRYYIDHHYKESISAADVAAAMFMSQSYASRIFKRTTGMTIKAYINLRRVTAAKNLMIEGGKATDVYLRCGFADYTTFYRCFIKYTGMTPEEFKNIT